jgi:hypothetical protein
VGDGIEPATFGSTDGFAKSGPCIFRRIAECEEGRIAVFGLRWVTFALWNVQRFFRSLVTVELGVVFSIFLGLNLVQQWMKFPEKEHPFFWRHETSASRVTVLLGRAETSMGLLILTFDG